MVDWYFVGPIITVIIVTGTLVTALLAYNEVYNQCWDWAKELNNAAVWGSTGTAYYECMEKNWPQFPEVELPQLVKISPP
jgi:hypothetical protein